ncbi:DUF4365 domain-containing protein [Fluviibacter phosphoraccumulans]|uniref:DUF4365 domain-containing protein n=1 Tax=Fluviibacter phosphoraccumulans TaxID=1751046 RepID=A0A7R6QXQ8_9RHOO|nr:DUF4365 domain-containing protein [Fluviibacter phosphoraccumulans]BBU69026.1 hypothetical protein ICHIAU1_13090 [Fluviibacter phosphoraccumulans]BBU71807.1 hypothetical protein ICHIJ1_17260 [Fluviibacter phosphoraccumulans]
MDPQKQKEQFQYAYVCALAAHAGLNRGSFDVDDDSIDITFQAKGNFGSGRLRSPMIQVQLKCSSQQMIADDVIKFPLKIKNYNDLRGDDVVVPRYLAVLLVPDDLEEWIAHNEDHIALFKSCHWLSLRDYGPTDNQTTVTVDVPLSQRLTSKTLWQMMDRASAGESL